MVVNIADPINKVTILEEPENDHTGGHFGSVVLAFNATPGVTKHNFVNNIKIAMLLISTTTKYANNGDTIRFKINPETLIGSTNGAVAVGDTQIPVVPGIIDLFKSGTCFVGQELTLDTEHLYIITAFSDTHLTVLEPVANAHPSGTAVKITTVTTPAVFGKDNCT